MPRPQRFAFFTKRVRYEGISHAELAVYRSEDDGTVSHRVVLHRVGAAIPLTQRWDGYHVDAKRAIVLAINKKLGYIAPLASEAVASRAQATQHDVVKDPLPIRATTPVRADFIVPTYRYLPGTPVPMFAQPQAENCGSEGCVDCVTAVADTTVQVSVT